MLCVTSKAHKFNSRITLSAICMMFSDDRGSRPAVGSSSSEISLHPLQTLIVLMPVFGRRRVFRPSYLSYLPVRDLAQIIFLLPLPECRGDTGLKGLRFCPQCSEPEIIKDGEVRCCSGHGILEHARNVLASCKIFLQRDIFFTNKNRTLVEQGNKYRLSGSVR